MSRNDLFEKVFMKPSPARLRDIVVSLSVDNENLEQTRLHWDEKFQDFRFRSARLQMFLDTALLGSPSHPSKSVREDFSSQELKTMRFGVSLDETEFVLNLSVPADLKKRKVRSLVEQSNETPMGVRIEPAKFSAYLNSFWDDAWIYRERFFTNDSSKLLWERYNGNSSPDRQPLNVQLDGAIRTMDWVLMGAGSLTESDSGSLALLRAERNQTKLVHDFVPWNSRLTLIDVSPRHLGGNYSMPNLLGVDLNLGNALFARPTNERAKVDVFLERPAEATVFINGNPVRSLTLGSGAQTIEGISGRPGFNEGEVQIVYPDGKIEHVPFQFTQASPDVLPEGRREGSFSAGFRQIGQGQYGTSSDDWVASGTYLSGVSPFMNGKLGVATSSTLQVANIDILWIDDSISSWNLISTVSRDSSGSWGQRHDLQYSLRLSPASILARASYIQSTFHNAFFVPVSLQKVAFELGLDVSRAIWKGGMAANLSAQFKRKIDSTTTPIDYHLDLSYSLQAYRGLNLRASMGFNVSAGQYTPTASFTANYYFNTGSHTFYAMNQIANQMEYIAPRLEQTHRADSLLLGNSVIVVSRDSSNLVAGSYQTVWKNQSMGGWSWADGVGMVGGRSVSLSGSVAEDQYGLQLGTQRTTNYADLSASYNLSDQNRADMMSRSHYLSARMSSALMFADGAFAVGRPVRDGFVLVKGRQDLSSTQFRINPYEPNGSEFSRGGPWLAASYGMLSAYQPEIIQVQPDHPSVGVFMDGNQYSANNTYQQGFVLRIGRPAQVFVRMRLIDEASQPLKHTTFQIFSVSDSSTPVYRSFSSEDGTIQIGGLEPGKKYILRFGEDAFVKDLLIAIPKNAPKIFDMGDQKVENQSLSQLSKVTMLTNPVAPPQPASFGGAAGQTGDSPREDPPTPPGKAVY